MCAWLQKKIFTKSSARCQVNAWIYLLITILNWAFPISYSTVIRVGFAMHLGEKKTHTILFNMHFATFL